MFRVAVFSVFLLSGISAGQDSLHVYYYGGETIEQLTVRGVTVSISLADGGKFNQVAVCVDNASTDAVNVLASSFALHQTAPKDEELALKPEQDVERIAGRHVWSHVATGVSTGMTRMKEKVSGEKEEGPEPKSGDYDAQAHWLVHIDEMGKRGQTTTLAHSYLRNSTVFPGSKLFGVLWFDRHDVFAAGTVSVSLGSRFYVFPIPPPSWATTPPHPVKVETAGQQGKPADAVSANRDDAADPAAGVLGVFGENWIEGSFAGVKILEVTAKSAADLAGLRAGYVITEINGKRIASTNDLAAELGKRAPGTRIHIVYLVHTNLGWMPDHADAILASGE